MEFNFENKVIIITGGSSGIGAETAKMFAQYKAKLCLVGRNESRLQNVAQHCELISGNVPLCILVDLIQAGSCEKVITKTIEKFKRIDILVNCAGKLKLGTLHESDIDVFDELMAIHLRVPYYLTQLASPHLIKSKGNIVNIGSSYLERYKPGFLPYNVSKNALEKFTRHAAMEMVTEGVRVNIINPGMTRTNLIHNLNIDEGDVNYAYDNLIAELGLKKILEPKEVAKLILLAACDMMPNMTGSSLKIDGAVIV
ncbi:putative oxidoreductase [Papilio xuthus]|uniref:Putative oxidoreductase n=1 Tax=Papilio xuthus TaxID=66420 RepID=A0A194Q744_PAPXU|nr:putative oxidoreductase [Papilio xuthus]